MGAPKTENAVLLRLIPHTSVGAMDRNGGDPVHEISVAELVARGSAQPDRAALIDESRPDRGYAAVDRTSAFGARVGRRVGGSRIYIEQIAAMRARGCTNLFSARQGAAPYSGTCHHFLSRVIQMPKTLIPSSVDDGTRLEEALSLKGCSGGL